MTTTVLPDSPLRRPTACLTLKGEAVRLLYGFLAALAVLDADDQADVVDLAVRELNDDD